MARLQAEINIILVAMQKWPQKILRAWSHPNLNCQNQRSRRVKRTILGATLGDFRGILGAILGSRGVTTWGFKGCLKPPILGATLGADSRNWLDAKISAQFSEPFFKIGVASRAPGTSFRKL